MKVRPAKPRYLFPEAMGCPPLGLDDRCRNTNAPHDSTQSYENAASEARYGLPPVGLGRSLPQQQLHSVPVHGVRVATCTAPSTPWACGRPSPVANPARAPDMAGNKMSLLYALLISNGAAMGTTTLLLLCAAFVAAGAAQLLTSAHCE